MPEVSRFFGIVIAMYHDDHQPPHFTHDTRDARFKSASLMVAFEETFRRGRWDSCSSGGACTRSELAANWQLVSDGDAPNHIQPLE